jgi:hypothetical protein
MSTKTWIAVLTAASLSLPMIPSPASADYRGGAFAAGLIGAALGTAIMMQGARGAPSYQRTHRRVRAKPAPAPTEARNAKDPFAGASAPSDYAKPVSNRIP